MPEPLRQGAAAIGDCPQKPISTLHTDPQGRWRVPEQGYESPPAPFPPLVGPVRGGIMDVWSIFNDCLLLRVTGQFHARHKKNSRCRKDNKELFAFFSGLESKRLLMPSVFVFDVVTLQREFFSTAISVHSPRFCRWTKWSFLVLKELVRWCAS